MVSRKETGRRDARALKTTEQLWKRYESLIPKGASKTQLKETKKAFYAGLTEMLQAISIASEQPVDRAARYMTKIDKELNQFWEGLNELPKKQTSTGSEHDSRA